MTTSMSRRIDILCIPSRFGSGFLNSNAAHLAMCEDWYFIYMSKTLA